MKLKAVLQAQAIWFLRPTGSYGYLPKTAGLLRDKFQFQGVPTDEELLKLDLAKGPLVFRHGSFEIAGRTVVIDPLQIYPVGVLAGSNTSTDDTEAFLKYLIEWASKTLQIEYQTLQEPGYNSQLEIQLSKSLSEYVPQMNTVCETASQFVPKFFKNRPVYEVAGITLSFDKLKVTPAPGNVRIERRENAPYEDNLYFTEGPFKTSDHLRLLETLENTLAG